MNLWSLCFQLGMRMPGDVRISESAPFLFLSIKPEVEDGTLGGIFKESSSVIEKVKRQFSAFRRFVFFT